MDGRTVWMWVRTWVRMRGCVKVAWVVGKAYEARLLWAKKRELSSR